jgi:hypothetical protein
MRYPRNTGSCSPDLRLHAWEPEYRITSVPSKHALAGQLIER